MIKKFYLLCSASLNLFFSLDLFSMEEREILNNPINIVNRSNHNLRIDSIYSKGMLGRAEEISLAPGQKSTLAATINGLLFLSVYSDILKKEIIDLNILKNAARKFPNNPIELSVFIENINLEPSYSVTSSEVRELPKKILQQQVQREKKRKQLEEYEKMEARPAKSVKHEEKVVRQTNIREQIEHYKKIYPFLFENVPPKYHLYIAMEISNDIKTKKIDFEKLSTESDRVFSYVINAILHTLSPKQPVDFSRPSSGYIYINLENIKGSTFTPPRKSNNYCDNVSSVIRRGGQDLNKLVGNYKIHLMPRSADFIETIIKLTQTINMHPEFGSTISALKVLAPKSFQESILLKRLSNEESYARIVIYPANGKQNAQKVLDKIIELFGNQDGVGVAPRFNQEVTSMIYFAQGDGDCKKLPAFQDYFEQPDMIYYKSDIAGQKEDYRLNF